MARACSSAFDRTYGPGWVSEEGHWQRSDNACQSSQFIQRFRDTPSSKYVDEFPTLVNKTMFILGDSVGRQLWDQLCFEIGAPKNVRNPPGVEPVVHYSEASVCTQPELNFTIVGFHQYGKSFLHQHESAPFSQTIPDILSDLSLYCRLRERYRPDNPLLSREMLPRRSIRLRNPSPQPVEHAPHRYPRTGLHLPKRWSLGLPVHVQQGHYRETFPQLDP